MHFRTRVFLLTFVPISLLLGLSFLLVQAYVKGTVREGLLNSLRQNERQVAQLRDANNRQNAQLLAAFTRDDELKAAVRTFHPNGTAAQVAADSFGDPASSAPPLPDTAALPNAVSSDGQDDLVSGEDAPPLTGTLQEQLLRFGVRSGLDFIMVTGTDGTPLAGAVRAGGDAGSDSAELVPLFVFPQLSASSLLLFRGEPFQTGTAPLVSHGARLGSLIVGERLNLSSFATSTVLLHGPWIMQSDIAKDRLPQIGAKLRECRSRTECTVLLQGVEWLTMPIVDSAAGTDWTLYSLVDVDKSIRPVNTALRHIFLSVLFLSLLTAMICSFGWSRAIVRPIATMVSNLHAAAKTGRLPEFKMARSRIREIRDLEGSFNNAAASVRKATDDLDGAYLQFVYSLANALDARDCYTAGHSKRVSDLSCTIATAMGQSKEDVERLRMGALLHDIGKIGIPDALLQHPGRLSNEQFKTIKTHPLIGRRILQGVEGFAMYLPAVELHHENWDGTGYPRRNQREETPLDARIIHVADAYDAMTTDRAYRKGLDHEKAMEVLAENAGSQFDPDVVASLFQICAAAKFAHAPTEEPMLGGASLPNPPPPAIAPVTEGMKPHEQLQVPEPTATEAVPAIACRA